VFLSPFVVAAYTKVRLRAVSPTRRRGKKSLLTRRDATLRISRAPAGGISQGSTCICLPARSRFGEGRALFEQSVKHDLFCSQIGIDYLPIIFLNSSSVRILRPNSLALSNLEPGSSPATTKSTFFEMLEAVFPPWASTRLRTSSLP